jgi:hypothetical protein
MFDEMTTSSLLGYTLGNEDASDLELELADRLTSAIEEIEHMSRLIASLEYENGENARG